MSHEHNFECFHLKREGQPIRSNYAVLSPSQHLKPIDGKITWHIDEACLTPDMDKYKTIFAFEQAFRKWEEVLFPITFQSVGDITKSQITIRFKNNNSLGLPYQFDDNTLAYAFSPFGESLGINSDMYFNEAYQWDEIHKPGSIYLFKVAVHELGHCLNIGHQLADLKDIMYPMYQPNGDVIVNDDTRKGIYDLYKQYGVQYRPLVPPKIEVDPNLKIFIKSLYTSKTTLLKLTSPQLDVLGKILGITFVKNDNITKKVNKLWEVIITF